MLISETPALRRSALIADFALFKNDESLTSAGKEEPLGFWVVVCFLVVVTGFLVVVCFLVVVLVVLDAFFVVVCLLPEALAAVAVVVVVAVLSSVVSVSEELLSSDAEVSSVSEVLCELLEGKLLSGTGFCLSVLVHEQRPKTTINADNVAIMRFAICVIPLIMYLGKIYRKYSITADLKCQ